MAAGEMAPAQALVEQLAGQGRQVLNRLLNGQQVREKIADKIGAVKTCYQRLVAQLADPLFDQQGGDVIAAADRVVLLSGQQLGQLDLLKEVARGKVQVGRGKLGLPLLEAIHHAPQALIDGGEVLLAAAEDQNFFGSPLKDGLGNQVSAAIIVTADQGYFPGNRPVKGDSRQLPGQGQGRFRQAGDQTAKFIAF